MATQQNTMAGPVALLMASGSIKAPLTTNSNKNRSEYRVSLVTNIAPFEVCTHIEYNIQINKNTSWSHYATEVFLFKSMLS
jgi:hypothetical protein